MKHFDFIETKLYRKNTDVFPVEIFQTHNCKRNFPSFFRREIPEFLPQWIFPILLCSCLSLSLPSIQWKCSNPVYSYEEFCICVRKCVSAMAISTSVHTYWQSTVSQALPVTRLHSQWVNKEKSLSILEKAKSLSYLVSAASPRQRHKCSWTRTLGTERGPSFLCTPRCCCDCETIWSIPIHLHRPIPAARSVQPEALWVLTPLWTPRAPAPPLLVRHRLVLRYD